MDRLPNFHYRYLVDAKFKRFSARSAGLLKQPIDYIRNDALVKSSRVSDCVGYSEPINLSLYKCFPRRHPELAIWQVQAFKQKLYE